MTKQQQKYISFIEINIDDPETEVALNLICVDDSSRKTVGIPIRPRPVKDLIHETSKKANETTKNDSTSKNKLQIDKKDLISGKALQVR